MQSIIVITSLLAIGTSAFAPVSQTSVRKSTHLADDLFGEKSKGSGKNDMSKSLPFAARPKILDGTMAGDVGFDPFGFGGNDKASLTNMREAELKHCRLAMLAAVGWPLAELFDKPIADAAGLPTALTKSGASPSILNGGLDNIEIAYWVAVAALAGIVELENMKVKEEKGKAYIAGDCGFDPLGLLPKDKAAQKEMMTKELKNGRLAMMAVLGFAGQEFLFQSPVVAETPVFFQPLF